MRRFASVFVKRDKKKKDEQKHQPTPTQLALLPPSAPSPASSLSTPQLSIASDPAHESASSYSNSIHTPNDDPEPKRSWRSWIAPRRSASYKQNPPPKQPIPPWPPKPDTSSTHDDDSTHENYDPIYSPVDRHIQANHNVAVVLRNSLVPPLPVSPFVQHNLGPFFPRSSNRPSLLAPQSDVRKQMLAARLLARLSHLSPSELSSITPFASRPPYALLSPQPQNFPDATHPIATHTKALPSSPGLRRWIGRPCFEDRHQVYLATDSGVVCLPVSAASLAVAALEYSECIDVMIDPDFDQYPISPASNVLEHSPLLEPTTPATQSHAPAPVETAQPPPAQKRNSYTAAPSPLRNQHSPPPTPTTHPVEHSTPKTILKRNVRFAEDGSDPEDGLPLHVIRMKKKREQKADFLRQERLKRVREEQEERHRQEVRARQEVIEREQREQRRQALEKERKDKEKALYAETITATRARRESSRAGLVVPLNNQPSSNLLAASPSFSSLKDSERNKPADSSRRFSRSPLDHPPSLSIPRRESSGDSALHLNSYAAHQQYDSSPGSSRPPSLGYSPNSPSSRPPSTYSAHTSSSEDVRHHGSRRNSMNAAAVAASSSSIYSRPPMIVSYPTWSGSNPNFQYIPPVPPFPDFVHDMPLLPPTAPFMKPSYKSRSSSSSSRSRKESHNSSSEHVPNSPAQKQSRTPSSSPHQSRPQPQRQSSASSLPRPTHHRRGSGESRNTSRTQASQTRPVPTTSHSHPSLSRGRPVQPQYLQAPSPWMPAVPVVPIQQQQQMMMMQPQMVMVPAVFPNPYAQMGLAANASNLHNYNAAGGSTSNGRRSYRPVIS